MISDLSALPKKRLYTPSSAVLVASFNQVWEYAYLNATDWKVVRICGLDTLISSKIRCVLQTKSEAINRTTTGWWKASSRWSNCKYDVSIYWWNWWKAWKGSNSAHTTSEGQNTTGCCTWETISETPERRVFDWELHGRKRYEKGFSSFKKRLDAFLRGCNL